MLFSLIKNSVFYAIYEYYKSSFIELFCVNKELPQLKCEGKCKLAKMQQEERDEKSANTLKQLQTEGIYFLSLIGDCSAVYSDFGDAIGISHKPFYNRLYAFIFIAKPIKPPTFYIG